MLFSVTFESKCVIIDTEDKSKIISLAIEKFKKILPVVPSVDEVDLEGFHEVMNCQFTITDASEIPDRGRLFITNKITANSKR